MFPFFSRYRAYQQWTCLKWSSNEVSSLHQKIASQNQSLFILKYARNSKNNGPRGVQGVKRCVTENIRSKSYKCNKLQSVRITAVFPPHAAYSSVTRRSRRCRQSSLKVFDIAFISLFFFFYPANQIYWTTKQGMSVGMINSMWTHRYPTRLNTWRVKDQKQMWQLTVFFERLIVTHTQCDIRTTCEFSLNSRLVKYGCVVYVQCMYMCWWWVSSYVLSS